MSGDVGKGVSSCPGYQGYVPSHSLPPLPAKPLSERVSANTRRQRTTSTPGAPPQRKWGTASLRKRPMPCDSEYSSMYCNTLNDDNTLQFRASEPSFRKKPSWLSRNLKIDDPTMCSSYSHDIGMANQQMPYTFSRFASTADLAKGTSKAGTKALPGYMGHVPAAEHTVRATTDFGEPLQLKRRKQKEITLKEERRRLRLPHFGMESTQKSAYRKPEGHIQQFQAEEGRCPKVNAMRKGFFSYGGTSDGIASAEKFYHLMRPAEGRLGVGAPEERQWTRQEQLQRSFIFTSTM